MVVFIIAISSQNYFWASRVACQPYPAGHTTDKQFLSPISFANTPRSSPFPRATRRLGYQFPPVRLQRLTYLNKIWKYIKGLISNAIYKPNIDLTLKIRLSWISWY